MANIYCEQAAQAPVCKGYVTYRYDPKCELVFESHWAVKADGEVLVTLVDIEQGTPHFGKHRNGRSAHWVAADVLPHDAEFIGNYPAPSAA
jgi:hypothetical protein